MISIRGRLLFHLLTGVLAVGMLLAAGVYLFAREEIDEVFDYHLQQLALSLNYYAGSGAPAAATGNEDDEDSLEEFDSVMQVWAGERLQVYESRGHGTLPEKSLPGIATVRAGADDWRVFSVQQPGHVFQAAQPLSVRHRIAMEAAGWVLLPVLAVIPLFGVFVWLTVGRSLQPLTSVAAAVQKRSPDSLDPIEEESAPTEVKPLASAINLLMTRLKRTLALQRRFVADAAHEMRSPLTTLQLQAQLLETARSESERTTALRSLQRGLKEEVRLIEQLLALARVEPDGDMRFVTRVELDELAAELLEENLPMAEAKNIDIGITAKQSAIVPGDPGALRTMLRNLIDNAIRYTPENGRIDLSVLRSADCAIVEVKDTGLGIPPAERERVFDRFYRVAGADLPTGSGLGLAIVKSIVERHSGQVTLEEPSDHPGLLVRVTLPAG